MQRERILVQIAVDLDPIPGAFHTEADARERIAGMLLNAIPHYNPVLLNNE